MDPSWRGEGGGSASATLPPPNRAQIPTGGGWAAEARRRHFQIPLRSKLVAERSRLEIFMYSCNGREYLLLYEAFMLNIDYLFSERIFFVAGDRSVKYYCADQQNDSLTHLNQLEWWWRLKELISDEWSQNKCATGFSEEAWKPTSWSHCSRLLGRLYIQLQHHHSPYSNQSWPKSVTMNASVKKLNPMELDILVKCQWANFSHPENASHCWYSLLTHDSIIDQYEAGLNSILDIVSADQDNKSDEIDNNVIHSICCSP